MHIGPTRFLKVGVTKITFDIVRKILEGLVIVEGSCVKLIFGKCVNLDWGNYSKFEAVCITNHKNNMIKVEKKDEKAKAKEQVLFSS